VQLCLFSKVTGCPCFVCGATRAAAALLRGRIAAAFVLQPLACLLMIAGAAAASAHTLMLCLRRRTLRVTLTRRERVALAAAGVLLVLANWIYLLVSGGGSGG
jgi:hypothetical protein